jgi:hypothetical protein
MILQTTAFTKGTLWSLCNLVLCLEMDERDKKETMLDTRRNNVGWDTRKLYEVMLMEEIPGRG